MDIILPSEPVRKIRSGQRGIRGNVPGKGRFESTLEGDLMDLLRFSNSIEDFKPQPIRIPYTLPNGRPSRYTPDGLIFSNVICSTLPYSTKSNTGTTTSIAGGSFVLNSEPRVSSVEIRGGHSGCLRNSISARHIWPMYSFFRRIKTNCRQPKCLLTCWT